MTSVLSYLRLQSDVFFALPRFRSRNLSKMSRFKTILAASRSLSLSRTKFASVVNSLDLVAVTGSGQRALCTTCLLNKAEDRRSMMASLPKKDEGTQGDKSADIDASHLT